MFVVYQCINHWVVKREKSWTDIARAIEVDGLYNVVVRTRPDRLDIFSSDYALPIWQKRFGDSASIYGIRGTVVMTDNQGECPNVGRGFWSGFLGAAGGLVGLVIAAAKSSAGFGVTRALVSVGGPIFIAGAVLMGAALVVSGQKNDSYFSLDRMKQIADFQGSHEIRDKTITSGIE